MSAKYPSLENVKQSHKTILFEKFSHDKEDKVPELYSIIDSAKSSGTFGTDEFFTKIEDELTVRSFQEFLDKFAPKVYEYAISMGGKTEFAYTMDKDDVKDIDYREISIAQHPFFEMLWSMYTQKGESDKSNLEFQEDKVKEILTPKKQMEKAYEMRRRVQSLARDRFKAEQAHRSTAPYDEAIYQSRVEISETFDESPLMHLALAITGLTKTIDNLQKNIGQLEVPDGESPQLIKGRFCLDENGDAQVVAVPKATNAIAGVSQDALALEEGAVRDVLRLVARDVRESGPESKFVQDLVIQLYAPAEIVDENSAPDLPALRNMVEEKTARLESLQAIYQQAQGAFINSLVEITQKLLGVMTFFDHATTGGAKAELPYGLVVANCRVEKFLEKDEAKRDLQTFLSHLGNETNGKKIWLGILPDVLLPGVGQGSGGGHDYNAPLEKRGKRNESAVRGNKAAGTDLEGARAFLQMMDEAGILTVFSFQPGKKTSFAGFSLKTLEEMKKALERVDNPHAVCAYPNFTVMRDGTIDLGDNHLVTVPAIYVSACYVAAGLLAASQQEKVLRARGLGDKLVPGEINARIDLENPEVNLALMTKFNRELAYSWPAEIVPEIVRDRFGFAFCSDFKTDEAGKPIKNSYIIQASTLEKEDNRYQPVYVTLLRDFVENYQRHRFPQGMNEDDAKTFLAIAADWQNDALRKDAEKKLNLVLRKDETIERGEGEDINFTIKLAGGQGRVKPKIKTKVR